MCHGNVAGAGYSHRGQLAGHLEVRGARRLQVPRLRPRDPGLQGPAPRHRRDRPPHLLPQVRGQEEASGQRGSEAPILFVFPPRGCSLERW